MRGMTSFDLGAGHAPYKEYFCSTPSSASIASSHFPPAAGCWEPPMSLRRAAPSFKTSPTLMSALQAMRRWTARGMGRMG